MRLAIFTVFLLVVFWNHHAEARPDGVAMDVHSTEPPAPNPTQASRPGDQADYIIKKTKPTCLCETETTLPDGTRVYATVAPICRCPNRNKKGWWASFKSLFG